MMAEQLDQLLEALNRMRRTAKRTPEAAHQIREGVGLAVRLADRLQRSGASPPKVA